MSSPSITALCLPNSLLLLVHLHILEYAHANSAEYDHNIFNLRTRGLRERAKTMEDIAYFLVGKIEGKGVKTILASYPCSQPSESLAFRTSLTKYIESLRHQSIYPASSRSSTNGKATSKPSFADLDSGAVGWWWKDVVVRKSLLEECSGDKFERLMLSMSTHALMRTSRLLSPETMSALLRSQPLAYSTALAQYQGTRHAWTKSASLLTRSELDLKALRERIQSQSSVTASKYSTLSTVRLQALAESGFQELLQRPWVGEDGKNALLFLVELAGLKSTTSDSKILLSRAQVQVDTSSKPQVIPSPLPIAAAHHPAHLKRLRRPVFQIKPKAPAGGDSVPPIPSRSHAEIILAGHLDSEKRMRQTLADALARVEKRSLEMSEKFKSLITTRTAHGGPTTSGFGFWNLSNERVGTINFSPEPDRELMASLGFELEFDILQSDGVDDDEALERKIEDIRGSILPAYPSIPDLSAPRLPPRDFKPANMKSGDMESKIPQTQTKATSSSRSQTRTATTSVPTTSSSLQVPTTDGPSTPSMSPSKSSRSIRRKSVRFSMARRRTGRPSMFRVFSGELNNEVDRLVDETHDFPTDDEDTENEYSSPYKTPRGKAKQKVNRIWTAGTPATAKKGTPKPRESAALALLLDMDPPMGMPRLASSTWSVSSDEFGGGIGASEDSDGGWAARNVDATPRPARRSMHRQVSKSIDSEDEEGEKILEDEGLTDEEDVFGDDPPSMTLKEILLSADTSHFDLLEAGSEDMEEGMLVEDASFVWE